VDCVQPVDRHHDRHPMRQMRLCVHHEMAFSMCTKDHFELTPKVLKGVRRSKGKVIY